MKRMLCAIAIIAVSCTVSLVSNRYVNTAIDEIIFTSENEPDKLRDLWNEKREILSAILKNSDIYSIEEIIYGENDTENLITTIKSIKDGEKFTFGNIF